MKHYIGRVVAFAVFCGLTGCSGGPVSAEEGTQETTQPLLQSIDWFQNASPTPGPAVQDAFCFLTKISGSFRGGGESVSLDVINNRWQLGGRSSQSGVAASAACVRWSELGASGGSVTFATGFTTSASFATGGDSHQLCYMTGFTGETNGGGEGVAVSVTGSGYRLVASSLSGTGMAGKMTCVRSVGGRPFSFLGSFHLAQNGTSLCTNSTNCFNSRTITGSPGFYCMLNQLAGKMRGGGEQGSVVFNNNLNWTLNADSMQGCSGGGCALNTTASCLFY